MQAAALGAVVGIEEAAVRALTKVVQVMPLRLRRRVDALRTATVPVGWPEAGPTVDPAVLVTLAQACRDTERLEFAYTTRDGAATSRLVEPLRLVPSSRRWYLVAYDLTRHDWRSFRLDRLTAPRSTGTPFRPRELPAADAAAFVRAALETAPTTSTVTEVLVHAAAGPVAAKLGRWASVEPVDAGCCRVRMTSDTMNWPAMALGSLDAEFEVIRPPELVAHLRDWAGRFDRATARTRSTQAVTWRTSRPKSSSREPMISRAPVGKMAATREPARTADQ